MTRIRAAIPPLLVGPLDDIVDICRHAGGRAIVVGGSVRDALFGADIMKTLDAEFFDKAPASGMRRGARQRRGRCAMVEDHDDAIRVGHLEHITPLTGHEVVVDHHDGIDVDRDQVARNDAGIAAFSGQDFFCNGHSHGGGSVRTLQ